MSKSLDFRRDNRTIEQFISDIKHRTAKEKFLIKLFAQEMVKDGHKIVLENYGTDNTGKFVSKSSCKPDYKVIINNNTHLCEIKNSPVNYKWTFKVYHLQQYVKYKAYIVLFYGTGFIDKDPTQIDIQNTKWGIIFPNKIVEMLKQNKPFPHPAFGYKSCIEISEEDFDCYIDKQRELTVL